LSQAADGGVAHGLRYVFQHSQFVYLRTQRIVIREPLQRFLLANYAYAAGHALSAGLMTKERSNAQQDAFKIDAVIEQHHHA
jgi:hypothetical protein